MDTYHNTENIESLIPNAPDISETEFGYENSRRAIADDDQGISVCEHIFDSCKDIIDIAGKIRKKYDGIEPPYSPQLLSEEGKSYKSNFNTGFMKTVCGKVAPRLYAYVNNAKFLDATTLPPTDPATGEEIPNYKEKSNRLRDIFSRTIRQWSKWYMFEVGLAEEVSLLGHCFVAWPDRYDWKPKLFRLDEAQVPHGTEILDDNVPFFVIKDIFYAHDLFDKIKNKDAAEQAGWNIENVVDEINHAIPIDRADQADQADALKYEDLKRECVPGWSYAIDAASIEYYELFATEYDGRVSHYVYAKESKKLLYSSEDEYPSMKDVVTAFTFGYGNGKVHGSHGVGHEIYDLAVKMEKARNSAMDNLNNRGKMVVAVQSPNELNKLKLIINDDCIYVAGGTPSGNVAALPNVVDAFIQLDQYITSIAEQKVGAYMPPPANTERTATEASIAASREDETKRAILEFWLKMIGSMTETMRRRMFNPESDIPDAQTAYQEAMKYCSEREIEIWANIGSNASIIEFSDQRSMQTAQYLSTKIGNPSYNQNKLERTITSMTVGTDYADELIIAQDDQTIGAEAARWQTVELQSLQQGMMVPVSPRDNDIVHMQMLMGQRDQTGNFTSGAIFGLASQGNQQGAMAALQHLSDHIASAKSKNTLGEYENETKAFMAQAEKQMQAMGISNNQAQ